VHWGDTVEADQRRLHGIGAPLQLDHPVGGRSVGDGKLPDREAGYAPTRSLKATMSSSMGSAMAWMDVQ
jgi:hypothetical protein